MLARLLYAIINILLPHSVCATFLIENAVTNVTRKFIYMYVIVYVDYTQYVLGSETSAKG